jgi:hypothetical protein
MQDYAAKDNPLAASEVTEAIYVTLFGVEIQVLTAIHGAQRWQKT